MFYKESKSKRKKSFFPFFLKGGGGGGERWGKEVRGDGGRKFNFFLQRIQILKKNLYVFFFFWGGGGGTKVSEYFLQRIYRITIYIFFFGRGD